MRVNMPSQFVEGAANGAESALEKIDIDNAAADAKRAASEFTHDAAERAKPLIDRLAQDAESLARRGIDGARDKTKLLREKALHVSDGTVGYIRDEPMKSVLIAAATGAALMALIGLLSRSRHHD